MDVPSWHPANQNADALRRQAMSGGTPAAKRTEFMVMAGSNVDTATEAERQLVAKEESAVRLGGGRGLLDPSDRLYLVEQLELEQAAKGREQQEREAALQTFRSNALKAHKTAVVSEIPLVAAASAKSKVLSPKKKPVVVIKAKKRVATSTDKDAKAKKVKTTAKKSVEKPASVGINGRAATTENKSDARGGKKSYETTNTTKPATKPPAPALLLQDYSSSSDEE